MQKASLIAISLINNNRCCFAHHRDYTSILSRVLLFCIFIKLACLVNDTAVDCRKCHHNRT